MLKIYQRYAPNATAPTTAYPLGSITNDSVPGADDGTPLEKDWGNNIEGFHQALMTEAALTASGSPDTAQASQLLDALKIVAASVVKQQMQTVFYPVNSYYISEDSTNPATLFGFGTWVSVAGRTLMGCDGTGTGTFGTPGSQGGSTSHGHNVGNTALTVDQIPSHTHQAGFAAGESDTTKPGMDLQGRTVPTPADWTVTTSSTGGGQPHGHSLSTTTTLPPYRVTYIWRRTA